jgi:segregation and condensation protein B
LEQADPQRIVEAVLFASSKPLRMAEIEAASQLSDDVIRRAISKLKREYDERGSSIEVAKIGIRYSMQLRKQYTGYGMPFAEVEVPKEVLKTAAYVAYNQPIRQSELVESLGSEVYELVRILRSAGLISVKKQGQTLLLTTSKRFPEYFGIPSSKKEDIKRWMEEQVSK